mmetsp:Transcript_36416/g.116710  ORF Transcript_36416/g.116710 Transcript_36416/m.116710 type:complete len:93 (-) Transcript_36416:75-353(-)
MTCLPFPSLPGEGRKPKEGKKEDPPSGRGADFIFIYTYNSEKKEDSLTYNIDDGRGPSFSSSPSLLLLFPSGWPAWSLSGPSLTSLLTQPAD